MKDTNIQQMEMMDTLHPMILTMMLRRVQKSKAELEQGHAAIM